MTQTDIQLLAEFLDCRDNLNIPENSKHWGIRFLDHMWDVHREEYYDHRYDEDIYASAKTAVADAARRYGFTQVQVLKILVEKLKGSNTVVLSEDWDVREIQEAKREFVETVVDEWAEEAACDFLGNPAKNMLDDMGLWPINYHLMYVMFVPGRDKIGFLSECILDGCLESLQIYDTKHNEVRLAKKILSLYPNMYALLLLAIYRYSDNDTNKRFHAGQAEFWVELNDCLKQKNLH